MKERVANGEHLARLRQGIGARNRWRQVHRKSQPDLSGAYLRGANFRGVNQIGAGIMAME